jgi:hypothetical protein
VETIETILLLGLVWALGATLDRAGRATFDAHLRERLRKRGCARPFPNEATVFDYVFDWGILTQSPPFFVLCISIVTLSYYL